MVYPVARSLFHKTKALKDGNQNAYRFVYCFRPFVIWKHGINVVLYYIRKQNGVRVCFCIECGISIDFSYSMNIVIVMNKHFQ